MHKVPPQLFRALVAAEQPVSARERPTLWESPQSVAIEPEPSRNRLYKFGDIGSGTCDIAKHGGAMHAFRSAIAPRECGPRPRRGDR